MNKPKVLIVEDELGIANFMLQGLEEENLSPTHCLSGEDALVKINNEKFDVILLDWMMLNISGLEVCQTTRSTENPNKKTPIIFITAKDTVQDTIEGLNAGANDYIKKPFSFDELLERIKIHFRTKDEIKVLTLGNIKIDKSKFQVFVDNKEVSLTQREFELLEYLIKNKGQVCTRTNIIEDVWDIHFEYDTGVIDVFMNAIRKKLNLTKDQELIKTIRGVGYIANEI